MDIPIFGYPKALLKIAIRFRKAFPDVRQFNHFLRFVTAIGHYEKGSLAHINSLFVEHTNQSNFNRFLSSKFDLGLLKNEHINAINEIEKDGILVIDDTIIERNGKNIEYTDIFFDHNKKKYVRGYQVATSLFIGKYGKYPIALSIYRKFNKEDPAFKTKIEIQKENIEDAIKRGLNFSTVIGDSWYFTDDLVKFLNAKGKSWIFTSKGNRRVKIQGRWTSLDDLILPYAESQLLTIDGEVYSAWEKEVYIRGIGKLSVVVTEGINGKKYFMTNRLDWDSKKIIGTFLNRWDIEVMHREMKGNGLKRLFLRNGKKVEMDLCLYAIGRTLLEISTIITIEDHKELEEGIEIHKRLTGIEFIENASQKIMEFGKHAVEAMVKAIETPYKSTVKILKSLGLFTFNPLDKINAKL
jgi:hypothetical protein